MAKKEWKKLLSREGVDITTISGIDRVFFDCLGLVSGDQNDFFTYFNNKNLTHYTAVDPQKWGSILYAKYFGNVAQIKKYYRDGKALQKYITKQSNSFKKMKLDSLVLQKAFAEFRKEFEQINFIYSIVGWLAVEAWQNDFEAILNRLITTNRLEAERDAIMAAAYRPWRATALITLQKDLGAGVSAKRIIKKYQFLRSWSVVWHRPIDEAWIKNVTTTIHTKAAVPRYSFRQLCKKLQPSAEEKSFLEIAPYIIFFKDWRDDLRRFHVYSWNFLFDAIAKKFGVAYNDIGYLTLDEIEIGLKINKLAVNIDERKNKACIIFEKNRKITANTGTPEQLQVVSDLSQQQAQPTEIKGITAQKGRITGRVIVVKSFHDTKKVTDQHILVTNTTHPDYLPAMRKALAFVTNEGGMICHAAIVAREMKKPCIVGTKIATQLLKDGDLIEVDADRGVITKI